MATLTPTVVSPFLREATELKISELNRAKEGLKNRYSNNPAVLAAGHDIRKRVTALVEEMKKLDPQLENDEDDDLATMSRYLEQAQNDQSISPGKLLKFEKQLTDKLSIASNKLDVSSLHADLLMEALTVNTSTRSLASKLDKTTMDDEFEMVEEGELEAALEKFEKNTFTAREVDSDAIDKYLSGLFEGEFGQMALRSLRANIQETSTDVMDDEFEVDDEMLEMCIKDLIENGLLSEDKRRALQGYLQSEVVLRELASTLNMKCVRHWDWRNPQEGLPVTAREDASGRYSITVEEDIMDMLFLHTVAVGWSAKLKAAFQDIISDVNLWPRNELPSPDELDKREYYLGSHRPKKIPKPAAVCNVCHPPPPPPPPMGMMPPPPPVVFPPPVIQIKKKKSKATFPRLSPPNFYRNSNLNDERYRIFANNFFLPRLPERDGRLTCASQNETQDRLIKHLAAEMKVRKAFDGGVTATKMCLTSLETSLPHGTIIAVLKFIGMPKPWIEMFTRFLQALLNMGPLVRGTSDQVLQRQRGVPSAHAMGRLLSEAVLFFLDFAARRSSGAYLYRLADQCYFVGTEAQYHKCDTAFNDFRRVMGLDDEMFASDPKLSIGFLQRSDATNTFVIDDALVEKEARRVKKLLGSCSTVLEWIRTWNATWGTYATHLFGPLCNILGKPHLEAVTKAYNRIHEITFEGSNLTDHVKHLIQTHVRSELPDPPFALEPLLYMPVAYGGLGIKNPYSTLSLAREVSKEPGTEIDNFLKNEERYYNDAKETFNLWKPDARERKLNTIFNDNKDRIVTVFGGEDRAAEFLSMDDLVSRRENMSYPNLPLPPYPGPIPPPTFVPVLVSAWDEMLEEPVDDIQCSQRVADDLRRLAGTGGMKRWYSLDAEEKWVVQLYGEECFERYGGLELWHRDSVPLEALKIVRGENSDDWDDGVTVSSMSD